MCKPQLVKYLVHELEFDTNETGCDGSKSRSSQRRFSPLFLFIVEELNPPTAGQSLVFLTRRVEL